MQNKVARISLLRRIARKVKRRLFGTKFRGSEDYWERRYANLGNSGPGSYSKFAEFKAEVINAFAREQGVESVIEYGCGDGNQLKLFEFREYLGFDVSPTAVEACRGEFAGDSSKRFALMGEYGGQRADMTMSLDVIYHLVEDEVFEAYLRRLFGSAERFVIVYSSDREVAEESRRATHVRHRVFTRWVRDHLPQWKRIAHIPNRYPFNGDAREGSFADFHIYARVS